MIAAKLFTKKVNGVTHKVLEGKEIPKNFFTEKELKSLEEKKSVFKDAKTLSEFKKSKDTETLKAVKKSADGMKKISDARKPEVVEEKAETKTDKVVK